MHSYTHVNTNGVSRFSHDLISARVLKHISGIFLCLWAELYPHCTYSLKKRTGISRKHIALESIGINFTPIYSLTEGNKFRIQTWAVATGLVPAEIPFSNHYFLLYYIMAALKRCFQIPVQSFSGLSWSWSWTCDYTHTHTHSNPPHPHQPIMRSSPQSL